MIAALAVRSRVALGELLTPDRAYRASWLLASGEFCRVSCCSEDYPIVSDWPKLTARNAIHKWLSPIVDEFMDNGKELCLFGFEKDGEGEVVF